MFSRLFAGSARSASLAMTLLALLSLGLLAGCGSPAHAAPAVPVTITDQLIFGHPPHGTFTASAVVCPSGSFVDAVEFPPGNADPAAEQVHETFTCADNSGTFTIRFQPHLPSPDGTVPWSVESGTGAYAKLQGNGRLTVVVTGPSSLTATFSGALHLD